MKEIEQLYIESRKKYVNIMSSILRGDRAAAEDVVQEAFTRALYFHGTFNSDRGRLKAWFNTIMYNALRDIQREMRGYPSEDSANFSSEDVAHFMDFKEHPEKMLLLEHKINNVANPRHRRILELFFLLGYSAKEISQVEEKVSVSNVTTVVSRFRENNT